MASGGGRLRLWCATAAVLVWGVADPPRFDFEGASLGTDWSAAGDIGATRGELPELLAVLGGTGDATGGSDRGSEGERDDRERDDRERDDRGAASGAREADDRPMGLGVRLTSEAGGGLLFTKPGVVAADWSGYERVSVWIWRSAERMAAGTTTIELQVLERPVSGTGDARFWRRIDLEHTGWQRFEFDLAHLAWQQTRIPRWDRVQRMGLFLRDADDLWVDELRVHDDPDGSGPFLTAGEVARIAFGERAALGDGEALGPKLPESARDSKRGLDSDSDSDSGAEHDRTTRGSHPASDDDDDRRAPARVLARDGIELFTDAPDLDLERLHARLVDAAALLAPLLPEGGDERRTPRLVVFADDAGYRAFAPRLAQVFGREADAPSSGGYTLLAIAHGAWDDGYASDRPTFVHEFVHSYLSCRALLPNRTEWLQEGLATHVQMRMHRQASLDELVTDAAARIADTSLLEAVTDGERIGAHRYWLAMTLVQTLMERERYAERFPALIAAARDAGSTELGPLLESVYGSTYDELLVEWQALCAERYAVASDASAAEAGPARDDPR